MLINEIYEFFHNCGNLFYCCQNNYSAVKENEITISISDLAKIGEIGDNLNNTIIGIEDDTLRIQNEINKLKNEFNAMNEEGLIDQEWWKRIQGRVDADTQT